MSNIFQFRHELVAEYAAFSRSFTEVSAKDIARAVDAEYAESRFYAPVPHEDVAQTDRQCPTAGSRIQVKT
jgi:hypothetical protein